MTEGEGGGTSGGARPVSNSDYRTTWRGAHDLIRTSISEKYDLSTKVTTHVKLPVTSQSNCVVIFVANRIGDPQNRISEKYSLRLALRSKGYGVRCPHPTPSRP